MSGIWDLIGGAGSVAGGFMMADDMRGVGADAAAQMGELAGQLQQDSEFKGYGVQTGIGTTTVGADGTTVLGAGPNAGMQGQANANMGAAGAGYQQAMAAAQGNSMNPAYQQAMNAMQGGMQGMGSHQAGMMGASNQAMMNSMQDTGAREQEIYDRSMAMQQPGLDNMRAQQQSQEFAQGRSGVRGSQFGGTSEDAAMARAQMGAQNQASFQAMGQAQNEMMNQGQLANMYGSQGMQAAGVQNQIGQGMGNLGAGQAALGMQGAGMMNNIAGGQAQLGQAQMNNSYLDMQHQMQAAGLGQGNAGMAQTGQLTGAGYGAQLGLGGIQAQINAEKAASELFGNMYGAGMSAIGGIGNNGGNWWESLWNTATGGSPAGASQQSAAGDPAFSQMGLQRPGG